jgi:hypothetical protein
MCEQFAKSASAALLIMALVVGMASCKTLEEREFTAEEKYRAALVALEENTKLEALVSACVEAGGSSAVYAQNVQQNWWQQNWPYVAAANAEFNQRLRYQQKVMGHYIGQLEALRHQGLVLESVGSDITNTVLRTNHRDLACSRRLEPYAEGERDFSNNDELMYVLEVVRADHPLAEQSAPHKVPDYESDIEIRSKQGRSLFQVEKTARSELCSEAEGLLLAGRWPEEIYGIMCGGIAKRVVKCEWGSCKKIEGL